MVQINVERTEFLIFFFFTKNLYCLYISLSFQHFKWQNVHGIKQETNLIYITQFIQGAFWRWCLCFKCHHVYLEIFLYFRWLYQMMTTVYSSPYLADKRNRKILRNSELHVLSLSTQKQNEDCTNRFYFFLKADRINGGLRDSYSAVC